MATWTNISKNTSTWVNKSAGLYPGPLATWADLTIAWNVHYYTWGGHLRSPYTNLTKSSSAWANLSKS